MKTAGTAFLAVLVLSSLGIWGCAQQKNAAQARKISELEARYTKMEEDYRGMMTASENLRKKVSRLELEKTELAQQVEDLKVLVQDRDELKQKLAARTNERDSVRSQLAQFSKELQNFAHRVETVANTNPPDALTVWPVSQKSH